VPSRIGLLGGTFNPIHNAHLAIAREARKTVGLDRVVMIPSGDPPHKPPQGVASAKDRYEMVRLALGSDPAFAISDVEVRRPGKSYSIDTVRLLQQEFGNETRLYFLIGLDAFLEFPTWREPVTLLRLCSFVILSRPGLSFLALSTLPVIPRLPQESLIDLDKGRRTRLDVETGLQSLICLRVSPSSVSASDIRARLARGASTADLLPPAVESYILQHHIY
jgi:nicotinate-nucleotide adenylyltransferase